MARGLALSDYRAVLFDIDGTLVDSLPMIVPAIAEAAERFTGQRPTDGEIQSLIGVPLAGQMRQYGGADDSIEAMVALAIELMEARSDLERVFEPAVDTLRLAKARGLKTALVTSKSRAELLPFLNRFTGANDVDTTVCATDVQSPKPSPESALLACARLGVSPSEAIFIGDSIYDMRCARAAGMPCVAVAYGAASREILSRELPDLTLDTPEDLSRWANESFLQTTCREKS